MSHVLEKRAVVTGSCSAMGKEIVRRLLESHGVVYGVCRCMGTDILTGSFPEYITPLGVVVHVAETVPGGLMRLWKSTKEQLAGGVFIAISSIHHLTYDDDYAKSKRCQESLVKSLASTNPNIRVNAIRLGHIVGTKAWPVEDPTRLPEIPLGRFGTVAEVADAVEFMVNSKWMTGTILTLDGGTSAIL